MLYILGWVSRVSMCLRCTPSVDLAPSESRFVAEWLFLHGYLLASVLYAIKEHLGMHVVVRDDLVSFYLCRL